MPLTHSPNVAFRDCQYARIGRYLGNENCSMSGIATYSEFTYGRFALRIARVAPDATQDWSPDWPTAFRRLESLALTELGLRGVRKAREPGSGPYRIPALRFASHDAWKHPRRLPITLEIRLWETVTVENTSPISPAPSTPRPHHWCIACGDTIIPRRTGNPPKHCSIECLEWDLEDARKHRDRERASKLYTLRAWWRRRLGVRV